MDKNSFPPADRIRWLRNNMRPRSPIRVRGIAMIVALLHSSYSPSASYSASSSSAAEAFCTTPSHYSSSSSFSIRGVQRHHHRHHTTTTSRTRLHAESTIVDTTTTLLMIAGSGATATSLLLVAAWWWNTSRVEFHNPMTDVDEQRERRRQQLARSIEHRAIPWTDEELRMYDGTTNDDDDGGYPILMAVKEHVFDVSAKDGRHFYGPNGEYRIMAGRDASRFLAKNMLSEETDDERNVKLSVGEEANLEMWYWIIRNKYPLVGTYEKNNGDRETPKSQIIARNENNNDDDDAVS